MLSFVTITLRQILNFWVRIIVPTFDILIKEVA